MRELPHILFQLGKGDDPDAPFIRAMLDTGSGLFGCGNYHHMSRVAKAYPQAVKGVYTNNKYEKIGMSGSVKRDDGSFVSADLDVAFEFFMSYFTKDGEPTTIIIGTGPNVNINFIVGLPWIKETAAVYDTRDEIVNVRNWDVEPFRVEQRVPECYNTLPRPLPPQRLSTAPSSKTSRPWTLTFTR